MKHGAYRNGYAPRFISIQQAYKPSSVLTNELSASIIYLGL